MIADVVVFMCESSYRTLTATLLSLLPLVLDPLLLLGTHEIGVAL